MQIVTTHKNSDFDAFASVIAVTMLYPFSIPVLPKTINPNVKNFISLHKHIFNVYTPEVIQPNKVDSLIVVDTNNWDRLEGVEALREKKKLEITLWDHHAMPGDIKADWEYHEEMGATVTLLVRRLKKEKKILTPIQATLFLLGIYEDTGNLMFPSTKAEDAFAAGYLLERKADLKVMSSFLRPAYGSKQKDVLFNMLQSSNRVRVNGHKISINKTEIDGHVGSLSVVVNMFREIANVDAAFGIFSTKDKSKCMVIGRSGTDDIDVGAILRSFGGGGHPGAGAAMLKAVKPDTVEEMLLELIQGNQQSSIKIGDLMSFPAASVPPSMTMEKLDILLRKHNYSGVPVVEDGKIMGVISRRDFVKVRKHSDLQSPVKAYMKTNAVTISPDKSPMQAAKIMVKHDIGRLPVVENDRMIGIVTRSDVMLYFYDILPD